MELIAKSGKIYINGIDCYFEIKSILPKYKYLITSSAKIPMGFNDWEVKINIQLMYISESCTIRINKDKRIKFMFLSDGLMPFKDSLIKIIQDEIEIKEEIFNRNYVLTMLTNPNPNIRQSGRILVNKKLVPWF